MDDSICLPRKLFKNNFGLGLDGGGSCFKIAYTSEEGDNLRFHFRTFAKSEHLEALELMRSVCEGKLAPDTEILTCGISTNVFVDQIRQKVGLRPNNTLECARMVEAFQFLSTHLSWDEFIQMPSTAALQQAHDNATTIMDTNMAFVAADRKVNLEGDTWSGTNAQMQLSSSMEQGLPDNYVQPPSQITYPIILFVSGSVQYPLKVEADGAYRLGNWNPFGGKSMMGLGYSCTGAKTFAELHKLATSGHQSRVHQMVSSTISDSTDAAYGHLAKSQLKCYGFGQIADKHEVEYTEADMAAALVSTVTQTVARDAYMWASMLGVSQVFFCGGLGCSTYDIRDQISTEYGMMSLTHLQGHTSHHYYVRFGAYLAAIGVLLRNLELA